MTSTEAPPDETVIHVLWINAGLSCDGDSVALTRAFARSSVATIGNFWVDLTRATLYILLPIATVIAIAFVALGLPQTLGIGATRWSEDFPAGGGRFVVDATGYRVLVVNGVVVRQDGADTGARPGRVLRPASV